MNKDFQRIAKAITFIDSASGAQPSLDELARHLHLSPHHFHRLFSRYCGVTPKQFLQIITVKNAKAILDQQSSTYDAALAAGLSGGNRLHDHFVSIEAVTPGEYKSGGERLQFFWGHGECVFGNASIIWTSKGIHRIHFIDDDERCDTVISDCAREWPKAQFIAKESEASEKIRDIFDLKNTTKRFKLWVRGTNFQVSVWRALLSMSCGELRSYGAVAQQVGKPKASRAVGSAIAKNPVAYLIPCHRVIQNSGALGGYRWETQRKKIMLACEQLQKEG